MKEQHEERAIPQISKTASARIPTEAGEFRLHYFRNNVDDKEHLALVMGDVDGAADVLTRVHSECLTGDVFGSLRCDCGEQLATAMQMIADEGRGVVVYLRQEGRGIGLEAKLTAYNLQDQGYDTVEANLLLGHQADEREYWAAAGILSELGVQSIRLLTNNPAKLEHLTDLGVRVNARVALMPSVNAENAFYLDTKARRLRHMLETPPTQNRDDAIPPLARAQIERLRARAQRHFTETGLPHVTVSYAQSLDGSITATPGKPFPISSRPALTLTHALRAAHDGILVGVGAMLADDPRLNVRLIEGPNPAAVIVDSHLRTPATAQVFDHHERVWIATTDVGRPGAQALTERGAQFIETGAGSDGRVQLRPLLHELGRQGVRSIMVEGGAAVLSSFLRQGLACYAVVTISPLLLGGLHAIQGIGNGEPGAFPRLTGITRTEVGDDLVLWGALDYADRTNGCAPLHGSAQP